MKKIKINKLGFTPMEIMIGIIITIISFYLILGFFVSNKEIVSTYAQDLQCRATIEVKGSFTVDTTSEVSDRVGIDHFFNVLNNKCFVDHIKIKTKDQKEIFQTLANEQARCYFRYGEGEEEFLSRFGTSGNWCFICGVVEIENNDVKYDYSKYINYLEKTEYKKKEGKSISYFNYTNIKYSSVNENELVELKMELDSILADRDPSMVEFGAITIGKYEQLQDMSLKKIDSSEPIYIVYRYERLDKEMEEKLMQASIGAGAGLAGGLILGAAIESLGWAVATGVSCTLAVGTAPTVVGGAFFGTLCASSGIKTTQKFVSSVEKVVVSIEKVTRLNKLILKISKKLRYSKNGKLLAELDDVLKVGTRDEILVVSAKLKETGKYNNLVKKLESNVEVMNKYNINSVDDIAKITLENKQALLDLKKVIKETNEVVEKDLAKGMAELTKKNIGELESLKFENPDDAVKLANIARATLPLTGMVIGGEMGYNYNSNSTQYVDIMSKEQYYRLCGTERKIDERMKKLD